MTTRFSDSFEQNNVFDSVKVIRDTIGGFYGDASNITNINIAPGTVTSIKVDDGLSIKESSEITDKGTIELDDTILRKNKNNQVVSGDSTLNKPISLKRDLSTNIIKLDSIKSSIKLNNNTITNVSNDNITNTTLVNRETLNTKINDKYSHLNKIFPINSDGILNNHTLDLQSYTITNLGTTNNNNDAINKKYFSDNKLTINSNSGLLTTLNTYNFISLNVKTNSGLIIDSNGLSVDTDFTKIGAIKIPIYYGYSLPRNYSGLIYIKDSIGLNTTNNYIYKPCIALGHELSNIKGINKTGIQWNDLYNGNKIKTALWSYPNNSINITVKEKTSENYYSNGFSKSFYLNGQEIKNTIYINRHKTYHFILPTSYSNEEPYTFVIGTSENSGMIADIVNNGNNSGTIILTTDSNTPKVLYIFNGSYKYMGGKLEIDEDFNDIPSSIIPDSPIPTLYDTIYQGPLVMTNPNKYMNIKQYVGDGDFTTYLSIDYNDPNNIYIFGIKWSIKNQNIILEPEPEIELEPEPETIITTFTNLISNHNFETLNNWYFFTKDFNSNEWSELNTLNYRLIIPSGLIGNIDGRNVLSVTGSINTISKIYQSIDFDSLYNDNTNIVTLKITCSVVVPYNIYTDNLHIFIDFINSGNIVNTLVSDNKLSGNLATGEIIDISFNIDIIYSIYAPTGYIGKYISNLHIGAYITHNSDNIIWYIDNLKIFIIDEIFNVEPEPEFEPEPESEPISYLEYLLQTYLSFNTLNNTDLSIYDTNNINKTWNDSLVITTNIDSVTDSDVLYVDSTKYYLKTNNNSIKKFNYNFDSSFSICFWIKYASKIQGKDNFILQKRFNVTTNTGTVFPGYSISVLPDNFGNPSFIKFLIVDNSNRYKEWIYTFNTKLQLWNHCIFSYSNNELSFYYNSQLVIPTSINGISLSNPITNNLDLIIGYTFESIPFIFFIDEIRFYDYNINLSNAIDQIYNAQLFQYTLNTYLENYWKIDSSILYDYITNTNNLTIYGTEGLGNDYQVKSHNIKLNNYISLNIDKYISDATLNSFIKTNNYTSFINKLQPVEFKFNRASNINLWINPYLNHGSVIVQNEKRMIILSKLESNNFNQDASYGSYLTGVILSINSVLSPNLIDAQLESDVQSNNYINLSLFANKRKYNLYTDNLSLSNKWYNINLSYDGSNRINSWELFIDSINYPLRYDTYITTTIPAEIPYNFSNSFIKEITSINNSNNIWTSNYKYIIKNSVNIDVTLTIHPGTHIYLEKDVNMIITSNGGIDALGSENNPICFDTLYLNNIWGYIEVNENTSTNHKIKYVKISNCNNGLVLKNLQSHLTRNIIEYVEVFYSNLNGFTIDGGSIVLSKCSSLFNNISFEFKNYNYGSNNLLSINKNDNNYSKHIDTIEIVNGGSNYTTAAVSIIGAGSNATASVTIINGSITNIIVTNIGSGYNNDTTATILGNGTGAILSVKLKLNKFAYLIDNCTPILSDSTLINFQNNNSIINIKNNGGLQLNNHILYSNTSNTDGIILTDNTSESNLNISNSIFYLFSNIIRKNVDNIWSTIQVSVNLNNPNIYISNYDNYSEIVQLKSDLNTGAFQSSLWINNWSFLNKFYPKNIISITNTSVTNLVETIFLTNKLSFNLNYTTKHTLSNIELQIYNSITNIVVNVDLINNNTLICRKKFTLSTTENNNTSIWTSINNSNTSLLELFVLEKNKSYTLEIYPSSSILVNKNDSGILYKLTINQEPIYYRKIEYTHSNIELDCRNDGYLTFGSYDTNINNNNEFDNTIKYIGGINEIKLYSRILKNNEIEDIYNYNTADAEPEPIIPEPLEPEPIEPEPLELEPEPEPIVSDKGNSKKLEILYLYHSSDGNDWNTSNRGLNVNSVNTYDIPNGFFDTILSHIFKKTNNLGDNCWTFESYDLNNGFPPLNSSNYSSVYLNKYDLIFTACPAGKNSNNTWVLYQNNKTIIETYVETGGVFFYRLAGWTLNVGVKLETPGDVVYQEKSFDWNNLPYTIKNNGFITSKRITESNDINVNDDIIGYPSVPAMTSININPSDIWSSKVKNVIKQWAYYDDGLDINNIVLLTYKYGLGEVIINTTNEGLYMNTLGSPSYGDIEYITYFANTLLWGFQRTRYAKDINMYLSNIVIEKNYQYLFNRVINKPNNEHIQVLPNRENNIISSNTNTNNNNTNTNLNTSVTLKDLLAILESNLSNIDITYTSNTIENVFFNTEKGIYNNWSLWHGDIHTIREKLYWSLSSIQNPNNIIIQHNQIYGLKNKSPLDSNLLPPRLSLAYYNTDNILVSIDPSPGYLAEPEPIEPEPIIQTDLVYLEPELEHEPEPEPEPEEFIIDEISILEPEPLFEIMESETMIPEPEPLIIENFRLYLIPFIYKIILNINLLEPNDKPNYIDISKRILDTDIIKYKEGLGLFDSFIEKSNEFIYLIPEINLFNQSYNKIIRFGVNNNNNDNILQIPNINDNKLTFSSGFANNIYGFLIPYKMVHDNSINYHGNLYRFRLYDNWNRLTKNTIPTEFFTNFDLQNRVLKFKPNDNLEEYEYFIETISAFPTITSNIINLVNNYTILLNDYFKIYDKLYDRVVIHKNGSITFGSDTQDSILYILNTHLDKTRISFLYRELIINNNTNISYQIEYLNTIHRLVITFNNIYQPQTFNKGSVQIHLYLNKSFYKYRGIIEIYYLDCNINNFTVGLSNGKGIPFNFDYLDFSKKDFSDYVIELEPEYEPEPEPIEPEPEPEPELEPEPEPEPELEPEPEPEPLPILLTEVEPEPIYFNLELTNILWENFIFVNIIDVQHINYNVSYLGMNSLSFRDLSIYNNKQYLVKYDNNTISNSGVQIRYLGNNSIKLSSGQWLDFTPNDIFAIFNNNEFTYNLWLYIDSNDIANLDNTPSYIIYNAYPLVTEPTNGFAIYLNKINNISYLNIVFFGATDWSQTINLSDIDENIYINNWFMVTLTFKLFGNLGQYNTQFYINKTKYLDSTPLYNKIWGNTSNPTIYFGNKFANNNSNHFIGYFGSIMILNKHVSDSQLIELYNLRYLPTIHEPEPEPEPIELETELELEAEIELELEPIEPEPIEPELIEPEPLEPLEPESEPGHEPEPEPEPEPEVNP